LKKYAVISDIHGNVWALETVLDDIARRGIVTIFNLGDSLYGPLEPQKTAELLFDQPMISIMGNEDEILIDDSKPKSPTLEFVLKDISSQTVNWLAATHLDNLVFGNQFYLCHAAPASKQEYLLEVPTKNGGVLKEEPHILDRLSKITQPVVLCGHSHFPRSVMLSTGQFILNPGSVGLPAYDDDQPVPHKMEAGSPHTRYIILTENENGWSVEQITLPYAWESAARAAEQRNRPDWAAWLRTGRA
jgi:predicted phosphodiesterase